ncbi:unnamed protein product [Heligmosomoides polygyrus]|uniref:Endo/exonuclease/phosphatase domain-containing protein n=1 Tax=Heligmosomoides polygyrus TaxID=6339 RepID=A0A183F546_HELPZ|nr:unnamed protein product [Heligmosomoides polygyrus]
MKRSSIRTEKDHGFYMVIVGDFNAKMGPRKLQKSHTGSQAIHRNSSGNFQQFEKSRNPRLPFPNKIDHNIFNRRNSQGDKPAWMSMIVRQLLADIRACEAVQNGNKAKLTPLRSHDGIVSTSRGAMEKAIDDFYPDVIDSNVHLPHLPHFRDPPRHIIGGESAPSQWKTSRAVLLYKKGDVHYIGNYRPICLLSVVNKLFIESS